MYGLALCAGIGGIELGLQLALGEHYRTVCYVEREAFAAATLVARMEDAALDQAPIWDDLKTFDGTAWRGLVDIITGGYPCQPFSLTGKRLGASDERHLWPDIFRIVQEVQPTLCFFENVPGHLSLGYGAVERDLQRLGYRVKAGLYSAAEVGASHRRERLFILAYREDAGLEGREYEPKQPGLRCCGTELDNAASNGDQGRGERTLQVARSSPTLFPPAPNDADEWRNAIEADPTLEPAICGMANGATIRVDRLRACGNGVVPLVAAKAFVCLAAKLGIGNEGEY